VTRLLSRLAGLQGLESRLEEVSHEVGPALDWLWN